MMNKPAFTGRDAPSIEVHNLRKQYEQREILRDINFSVRRGEMLAIIGPSGCGKSTTLKIISGLEEPSDGQVIIRESKIGMAFQYSALLNSYTIAENIAFALHDSQYSSKQIDDIVRQKLEMVGLAEFYDAMPDELSGGQQKRASFARAIANNPEIILYDEPTAGLDPITSTLIEDYMNKLSRQNAGIVVTHQHSTIRRTASKIICLMRGEIVWSGTVGELDTSKNPYIRQFIDGAVHGPFTDE